VERRDLEEEMMNPNSFSILGYLSVLLWLAVPLLWLLRRRIKAPGWSALALAVIAFGLAAINSRSHVSRIQAEVNHTSPDAIMQEAAKRKAVEDARGGEVADIRFAEDGAEDFIDKAGMDESDRKYLESLDESKDPAWKNRKKSRGDAAQESDDLEDMLGGEEPTKRLSTDALPEEKETRPPIFMSEAHVAAAQRLNSINLNASLYVILLGAIILIVDYLARANSYSQAAFPLPLPAAWRNSFTPLPAVVTRPEKPRRTLTDELAHLARRGDAFVCFTKDASTLPESFPTLGKSSRPIDLLRVQGDRISDSFVFESLWYGRSCFVVGSPPHAQTLFAEILRQLELRKTSRASTRHNVHLVWNLDQPPSKQDLTTFERLASSTGFSLLLCNDSRP
jgi:hypothetical protein